MVQTFKVFDGTDPLIVFSGQQEYILAVAQLCRNEGRFVDVTMKCSDGELHAHKLVLGSASLFLRNLLLSESENVTIVLEGYSVSIVNLVLDFLYTQKVNFQGQLLVTQGEVSAVQEIFDQLGVNPDNVSSEDFYPLSDESLLHETFQSKESTEFISDTIGSCDLKDEAPGENEKENVKSNANAPKRKRESSTCEQSKAKNARLSYNQNDMKKRSSKNRSSIEVPSGVHDMARVETWVCSICKCYNPPSQESLGDEIDWIGCDCSRWYHVDCTKIKVNSRSFSCKDLKFKCLRPV